MKQRITSYRRAFTLVELSIVLVIVGLLIGGILVGQTLIHAGELRRETVTIDQIKTGLLAFKDKYMGLPGDISNATQFWGAADGNDGLGTDCYIAVGAGTSTCNGNGDGLLEQGTENYRMWQQLVVAGFFKGTFTGVPGTPPYTL
ncbi:MAG: type II secretion system protein [Rickettsiales bacterium]